MGSPSYMLSIIGQNVVQCMTMILAMIP